MQRESNKNEAAHGGNHGRAGATIERVSESISSYGVLVNGRWETRKARVAPGSDAGRASGPRLESSNNKVTEVLEAATPGREKGGLRVVPVRCRSRFCPKCGPIYGWRTRQRILKAAPAFTCARLLTLTIDRSKFESPQAAYDHIVKGKYLPRLLRALKVTTWVRVVELQPKTGDGWPHWHIVVQSTDKIDLKTAWRLWRDTWGIGGVDLQHYASGFTSGRHAMMYITKYILKYPKRGFPPWVLLRDRLRVFDFSADLRAYLRDDGSEEDENKIPAIGPERASARPIVDRVSQCGQRSTVLLETVDKDTGEVKLEYRGTLDIGPDDLEVALCDKSMKGFSVATYVDTDTEGKETIRRYLGTESFRAIRVKDKGKDEYRRVWAGWRSPVPFEVDNLNVLIRESFEARTIRAERIETARARLLAWWDRIGDNNTSEKG